MLTQEAERGIALKNCFLPKPQWALLRFIAGDELADVLEEAEGKVAAFHVGEEVEVDRLAEDPGSNSFFNEDRSGAVLRLVNLRRLCASAGRAPG